MLDLWLVLCLQYLNHIWFGGYCRFYFLFFFNITEVRTCWHWTSYYFYLPICTAYANPFVASVCPFNFLFLVGFEYHQQSMILLSPLNSYLYQIYVLAIGGALTLNLGVRHFWLEIAIETNQAPQMWFLHPGSSTEHGVLPPRSISSLCLLCRHFTKPISVSNRQLSNWLMIPAVLAPPRPLAGFVYYYHVEACEQRYVNVHRPGCFMFALTN